jgi:4a-hydroxytetrahydrobiopterin dehydratase
MSRDKTLLSDEALKKFLGEHPKWAQAGKEIRRTFEFPTFLSGIDFVQKVAKFAEAADHHPDIDIRWRKVTLALTTHDAGGLTHRDVDLAALADAAAGF